ncbi:MAG TPA: DNA gyrase inhibitor YacG [Phenylobacterium sp.]|nr:DNA gyrase inhibitor YacG [Phenylobacterium sp.]
MSAAKCPICGRPAAAERAPFCSARCADVDLHRWLTGGYTVPATEEDEDVRDDDDEA